MMGRLPEPDDVDFVVSGGGSDPESLRQTLDYIAAYKSREGYAREVEKARAILASLQIDHIAYGMDDPKALLDHWLRLAGLDQTGPSTPVESNDKAI